MTEPAIFRRSHVFISLCSLALLGACVGNIGGVEQEEAFTGVGAGGGAGAEAAGGAGGELDFDVSGPSDEPCDEEQCPCALGDTQECYDGDPSLAGVGACHYGTQLCAPKDEGDEFSSPAWGACEGYGLPSAEICDGLDNDCDGQVDEDLVQACDASCGPGTQTCTAGSWSSCDPIIVEQAVNINGDCVWAQCPGATPYPVGCSIYFQGNNAHGCVAYVPGDTKVYLQEGEVCNAGHLSGKLMCSSCPAGGLNGGNCPINKPQPHYVQNYQDCPGDQP